MSYQHLAAFDVIVGQLSAVCIDLFGAYAVPLQPLARSEPLDLTAASVISVIGYGSEQLRGALTLIVPRPVADALVVETLGAPAGDDVVRDLIGEFSNLILGRLKNGLRVEGIVFQMSTPTTALGHDIELASARGNTACLCFGPRGRRLYVRLDATMDESLVLATERISVAPSAPGEMLLF